MITPGRFFTIITGLCLLLAAVFVAAIVVGPSEIGVGDAFSSLFGGCNDSIVNAIVNERLARACAALVSGMALSVSGAVFQAVLRNPLADPYILGVSGGAGLGAVLTVLISGGVIGVSAFGLAAPAGIGALAAVSVVVIVEMKRPGIGLEGIILLGVMINALCGSLIIAAATMLGESQLTSFFHWLLGSLSVAAYGVYNLVPAAIFAIGITMLLLLEARSLNLLMLHSDEAQTMGVRSGIMRRYCLVLAGFLTACSVALAGLVGFVGLLVPHVVRKLFGGDMRLMIPASALLGGTLLIACDIVARTVVRPSEMPVGVITAIVGAPAFIFILVSRARREQ